MQHHATHLLPLSVEDWQFDQICGCQQHLEITNKLISYLISLLIVHLQFQIRRFPLQLDILKNLIPKTLSLSTGNRACDHFAFTSVGKDAIHVLESFVNLILKKAQFYDIHTNTRASKERVKVKWMFLRQLGRLAL